MCSDLAGDDLAEPFLHESFARNDSLPGSVAYRTDLATFEAFVGSRARAPRLIVCHVGRCGSTLVANALNRIDSVRVLKEPRAVQALTEATSWRRRSDAAPPLPTSVPAAKRIAAAAGLEEAECDDLLARVIKVACPEGPESEAGWVLKLAPGEAIAAPILARLFPDCRFVVLRRPMEEVVRSAFFRHRYVDSDLLYLDSSDLSLLLPSIEPGPQRFLTIPDLIAHTWTSVNRSFEELPTDRTVSFDYHDLAADPAEAVETIAEFAGLDRAAARTPSVRAEFAVHSKSSGPGGRVPFDAEQQPPDLSPVIRSVLQAISA